MRRTTSALGITSSMRQPLVAPTSMNSMKRTMCPVPRKWRAMSTTWWSFMPRLTTMFTLTGARPAAAAQSIASSTFATGKSASFMARKVASSRRVEGHRDAPQARGVERARLLP